MSDDFWNIRHIKSAKKDHICTYCNQTIHKGDSYRREVGVYFSDFNFNKFCKRCQFTMPKLDPFKYGDFLGNFYDAIRNSDILICPKCKSYLNINIKFTNDSEKCICTCKKCGIDWIEDLTLEGIKKLLLK